VVGIAILASLLVSPYNYDYDLPIFGIAIALLLPWIIARASQLEKAVLLGCSWIACGWGLFLNFTQNISHPTSALAIFPPEQTYSVAGICLLVIYFGVLRISDRHPRPNILSWEGQRG
jgi:nitric oxide reductase large subunit